MLPPSSRPQVLWDAGLTPRSQCLAWDAAYAAWICHLCISTLSSSAPCHRRCCGLHFACPLPLHEAELLSEAWFSGLRKSALAAGISLPEEWQSRLFAPLNTFPSLQLCPCSDRPASGNWIAPAAQFFSPLCSHSQQEQTVPGTVPEYLGTGGGPG